MGQILAVLLVIALTTGLVYACCKLFDETRKYGGKPRRPPQPWELD
jgi:hypothetical protein